MRYIITVFDGYDYRNDILTVIDRFDVPTKEEAEAWIENHYTNDNWDIVCNIKEVKK